MRPAKIASELAYPMTEMSVIFAIVVFTLLYTLASAAGLFGIWLFAAIVPAYFRYLLYLLEARANGRAAPVPGVELFNWVENFWSLFPLVLLAAIFWGTWFLATTFSMTIALIFAATLFLFVPASMAVLAVTRSPLQSLNPISVLRLVGACGHDYPLILMQFGLASFLLFGLVLIGAPAILLSFAVLYQMVLLFTFTGSVLQENKIVFQIDIPDALEPGEDELHEQLVAERQKIANHAYGFVSRGNRAGGLQHIQSWIQKESDPDEAYRWFFNEMLKWESTDAALFFAQNWLSRLLYREQCVDALKLVSRCLIESERFKPLPEDRDKVIELARQAGHDELLSKLN